MNPLAPAEEIDPMTLDDARAWLIAREKHPKRITSDQLPGYFRVSGILLWRWHQHDPARGSDGPHELPEMVFRRLRRGLSMYPFLYAFREAAVRAAESAVVEAEAAGWDPPRDGAEVEIG